MNICTPEYWEDERSKVHFLSRIIPLDKDGTRFRPLIISSKVMKFLECLIINKLRAYCNKRMMRRQYGFSRGVGIS